ncbi:MAG: carbohydrate ABC transporter permease [Acidimicrobiales bacterium]
MTSTAPAPVPVDALPDTGPDPETRQRRRFWSAREPQTEYRDLDRRTKRFMAGSMVTMLAVILATAYLLPLGFMAVTSLKTEDQIGSGRILPMSPAVTEIDGVPRTLYEVPMPDGSVRSLALVSPGRQSSIFVDPDEPEILIEWEGVWRSLDQDLTFDPRTENFTRAWNTLDFMRLLRNTAVIAGLGMFGTVVSSTLVAYGLSRFRIPWKGFLLGSLIATIILPRFVTIVPTYAVFNQIGWVGTWLPLIIPHFFANAYNVFLLRQFFLTIPKDLDEAAAIDGAGPLTTLVTVIIPQAKGAILAVALFHFFYAWNDFLEPLIYLAGRRDLIPISVGLYDFLGIYDTQIALVQAGALIGMALPILVFLVLQRVFLRGIDLSGSMK